MSFGAPTAVIINDTYPAVAHFEVDAGSFLVVESDSTCLVFLQTGIPGPPGNGSVGPSNQGDGILIVGTEIRVNIEGLPLALGS